MTVEAESPARIGGAAVAVTDSEGAYRLENLPVGIYSVTFTLQGFSTVKRTDIRLEARRRDRSRAGRRSRRGAAGTTGGPVTYLFKGKQYLVVAIGGREYAPEWIALGFP